MAAATARRSPAHRQPRAGVDRARPSNLTGTFVTETVKCKVKDSGSIWNPTGGGNGKDEITVMELAGCKTTATICPHPKHVEVTALGLPWHSELFEKPPKKGDIVENVKLEVACSHVKLNEFEGELIGPVSPGVFEADEVLVEGSEEAEVELPDKLKAAGSGKIKIA
ncbi:MAG TPA: hypothetical protein VK721_10925 [Solirubrobacteraceae bacterium]|nr:hypothetical protein [Solirubrobacteraceae bacterium]